MKTLFKPIFNWFDLAILIIANVMLPEFGWPMFVGVLVLGAIISAAVEQRFYK